jgi:hypothetical protein
VVGEGGRELVAFKSTIDHCHVQRLQVRAERGSVKGWPSAANGPRTIKYEGPS